MPQSSHSSNNEIAMPVNRSRPYFATLFVCTAIAITLACETTLSDEWPQWRGPNRDGVWQETGVVEKFPSERLKRRWTQPIASGYSGPTVAGGRVYVTDRLVKPEQLERIHCFDWETGRRLWSHRYRAPYVKVGYTAGPRAAVTIDEGRAFALGAMGHLHCLDAASGKVIWQRDLNSDYKIRMPIWGIASAPIVDGGLLIVQIGGSDGACLVALNKKTGKEKLK